MAIEHPSALQVRDHFPDPNDFRPDPALLRVTEKHGDLHVTVENTETGARHDVWFNGTEMVHRIPA